MFANYTDVEAYFMGSPDGGENEVDSAGPASGPIPPEYLPSYAPPDPWCCGPSCQQDFILIAEFSEQERPKPLVSISMISIIKVCDSRNVLFHKLCQEAFNITKAAWL